MESHCHVIYTWKLKGYNTMVMHQNISKKEDSQYIVLNIGGGARILTLSCHSYGLQDTKEVVSGLGYEPENYRHQIFATNNKGECCWYYENVGIEFYHDGGDTLLG